MNWPFEYEVKSDNFDLPLCVRCGQVFRWQSQGDSFYGVVGKSAFSVQVTENRLTVRSNVSESDFKYIFDTENDFEAVKTILLAGDSELSEALESSRGLRMIRQADPVETVFSFLCSANNHIRRIEAMVNTLAEFGEEIGRWEEKSWRAFPTLEALSKIDEPYLRGKGFGYRAPRVSQCAAKIIEFGGLDWLNDLKAVEADHAVTELQALPGIGPKLAECIALFGLGHSSVVPIDTHMWNVVTRRYFPELKGTSLTASRRVMVREELRRRFGDLAGFAHQVLFVDEMLNWRTRR